jgi:hypothetical protein
MSGLEERMVSFTSLGAFARRFAIGAVLVLAASSAASSAWAGGIGPMTGLYEGKATCSGLQNGVPSKQKREFTAENPVGVTEGANRAVIAL